MYPTFSKPVVSSSISLGRIISMLRSFPSYGISRIYPETFYFEFNNNNHNNGDDDNNNSHHSRHYLFDSCDYGIVPYKLSYLFKGIKLGFKISTCMADKQRLKKHVAKNTGHYLTVSLWNDGEREVTLLAHHLHRFGLVLKTTIDRTSSNNPHASIT